MALKDEMDNLMDLEEAYKDPIKDDMQEIIRILKSIGDKLDTLIQERNYGLDYSENE
jgi:hypothetical protein